jgi:hypothetical protein
MKEKEKIKKLERQIKELTERIRVLENRPIYIPQPVHPVVIPLRERYADPYFRDPITNPPYRIT